MKKLLSTLFILIPVLLFGREIKNINELKSDDVIKLRLTFPRGIINKNLSPWNIKEKEQVDIELKVLSQDSESLELSILPIRWYIYYQSPQNKNVNIYLDSNFLIFSDSNPIFSLFDNNSVTAQVNKKNDNINIHFKAIQGEENINSSRKEWFVQPIEIPKGLKISDFENQFPVNELNFEEVINFTLKEFFDILKKTHELPWIIKNEKVFNTQLPYYIEIIDASFNLKANTTVVFYPSNPNDADNLLMDLENKLIKPTKKDKNSCVFEFFLASPQRAYIQNYILDLTPKDSLVITYNASDKNYIAKGKGAANSNYINTIRKFYDVTLNKKNNNTDLKETLTKGKDIYTSTLNKYEQEMNSYWLHSAQLSQNYWFASKEFRNYNKKAQESSLIQFHSDNEIPWDDLQIKELFPLADYLYQPYTYTEFIEDFFDYKAHEANNSVLTGMKYLKDDISGYYFADAVFWGYPKSLITSNNLKNMMIRFHLTKSQREYEDFITKNHDPEITESLKKLHNQLSKIEPNSNIKNLNLSVEKLIPLKNKADKYIILLVGDEMIGYNNITDKYETNINEIYNSLMDEIKTNELDDQVEICIITSEANKIEKNSDITKHIIYTDDSSLQDYKYKVVNQERTFLILRNDGELIDREQPSEYKSSPYFVIKEIKKDIDKRKTENTASSGVFNIVFVTLFSALLTFLIAKYTITKREKYKRYIQELELKAIRAQINPHFTFNALSSIQNLIAQKKDKIANEYLIKFAKLLRMILATSEKKLIPLSDEIELLKLYLELEQLRTPFTYHITIDKSINLENEEIPGMLIQPIIENAVKHGIASKKNGIINLEFHKKNNILKVTITDNGSGFSALTNHEGFGIQSVKERLNLIDKDLHLNTRLEIDNIIVDNVVKGAKVTIHIPI